MEFSTISYTLPERFMSALINDDYTGLDDGEDTELNEWLEGEDLPKGGHWVIKSSEGYFAHYNDYSTLGDTVVDVEYVYPVEPCGKELFIVYYKDRTEIQTSECDTVFSGSQSEIRAYLKELSV